MTDSSISGTDAAPKPNGGANNARAIAAVTGDGGMGCLAAPIRLPRQDRSSSPSLKIHHSNGTTFLSGSVRSR